MAQATCTILNEYGLHARPASLLVRTASQFEAEIHVQKGATKVSGKSIMGLMMLAAPMNTELVIHAEGSDEGEAIAAIAELISNKFGES